MSDALTDIARDERKAELVKRIRTLQANAELNKEEIMKLAEECDSIPRGYWTPRTTFVKDLKKEYGWNED